jgi:hypothetical protein
LSHDCKSNRTGGDGKEKEDDRHDLNLGAMPAGEEPFSLRENAGSIFVLCCERALVKRLELNERAAPEFDGARGAIG